MFQFCLTCFDCDWRPGQILFEDPVPPLIEVKENDSVSAGHGVVRMIPNEVVSLAICTQPINTVNINQHRIYSVMHVHIWYVTILYTHYSTHLVLKFYPDYNCYAILNMGDDCRSPKVHLFFTCWTFNFR